MLFFRSKLTLTPSSAGLIKMSDLVIIILITFAAIRRDESQVNSLFRMPRSSSDSRVKYNGLLFYRIFSNTPRVQNVYEVILEIYLIKWCRYLATRLTTGKVDGYWMDT